MMTYTEWANEYNNEIGLIKEKLIDLKQKKLNAKNLKEKNDLEERIFSLYGMYLDCIHITRVLKERAVALENITLN